LETVGGEPELPREDHGVSAEKLNAASPYVIAAITEVDGMIVEPGVAAESLLNYEREGFSVMRA
jgi:hypothetical protein